MSFGPGIFQPLSGSSQSYRHSFAPECSFTGTLSLRCAPCRSTMFALGTLTAVWRYHSWRRLGTSWSWSSAVTPWRRAAGRREHQAPVAPRCSEVVMWLGRRSGAQSSSHGLQIPHPGEGHLQVGAQRSPQERRHPCCSPQSSQSGKRSGDSPAQCGNRAELPVSPILGS